MDKKKVVLGIDIGGTNTDFGFVTQDGDIVAREHLDTAKYLKFEDFVEDLYAKVKKIIERENLNLIAVGIGAPNGNFYNGTIEFAPNLNWKDIVPVNETVERVFGVKSYLTNDANAATIGEMIFGGAKGYDDFVYITLGTGVGSGIVSNGKLIYGHDGFAGEVGHMTAVENGRECGCGRKGCLETYSSVTGLVNSVKLLREKDNLSGDWHNYSDDEITGKLIYEKAKEGDAIANKAFDIAAEKLGKTLAGVVAVTSPKAVFLFGGLANAKDIIFDLTKQHLEDSLLKIYKDKIKILPSELKGNEAAIKGAAALAWNEVRD